MLTSFLYLVFRLHTTSSTHQTPPTFTRTLRVEEESSRRPCSSGCSTFSNTGCRVRLWPSKRSPRLNRFSKNTSDKTSSTKKDGSILLRYNAKIVHSLCLFAPLSIEQLRHRLHYYGHFHIICIGMHNLFRSLAKLNILRLLEGCSCKMHIV